MTTPADHAATLRDAIYTSMASTQREDALAALDALQVQAETADEWHKLHIETLEAMSRTLAERDQFQMRMQQVIFERDEEKRISEMRGVEGRRILAERDAAVQAAVDYQRQSEEQAEEAIRWRAAAELAHAAMDAVQAVADEQGRAAEHAQQALRQIATIYPDTTHAGQIARAALTEDTT